MKSALIGLILTLVMYTLSHSAPVPVRLHHIEKMVGPLKQEELSTDHPHQAKLWGSIAQDYKIQVTLQAFQLKSLKGCLERAKEAMATKQALLINAQNYDLKSHPQEESGTYALAQIAGDACSVEASPSPKTARAPNSL